MKIALASSQQVTECNYFVHEFAISLHQNRTKSWAKM